MTSLWFLLFTYFIDSLIVFTYSKSIYEEKKKSIISFGIIFSIYLILLVIFKFVSNNEIVSLIAIIIANILIIYFLYKSSLKSAAFHGFALGLSQFLSEFLTAYISAMLLHITTEESVNSHFELGAISSMILYFLITRLLSKISVRESNSHSWGKWLSLSILPIGSFMVLISFRMISKDLPLNAMENTFLIISVSFLLLINIVIYMIYEKAEKSNQKLIELELISQKSKIDMQYLRLLEKKNEKMDVMAHDYKNHMTTIEAMSDSSTVNEYINNMLGEISEYNQIAKTRNRILDVILYKYKEICIDKKIIFETDIMTDNLSFINDTDISALFNNILDNAVESSERSTNKLIYIQISNSLNSYHKIVVKNSCDNQPNTKNGKLITTKKDKEIHGFGTKSIEKVVNKYNGEIQWNYDSVNKQFELMILIPNEQ